jgi:hypothetical protein
MTEAEWLTCADPKAMLAHRGQKLSDRKLRLFSCACCRRVWNFVTDERLKTALDNLERFADKAASEKQRTEAGKLVSAFRQQHYDDVGKEEEICIAVELWTAATKTMRRVVTRCGEGAAGAFAWADVGDFNRRTQEERSAQAQLLRDIFANPFRPVALDPSWRTSDVLTLARGIYDERAFDRMPILADALQDAGCTSEDMLNHCRAETVHVRGCWVVDLVLGKPE